MVIKEINKIIKKQYDNDLVTIVLSHANTEQKRKILIDLLKSIKTKILLSTNYPIDDEIESLCDYVIYDDENPILLKEEFIEYNSTFYWKKIRNGKEQIKYFDYEHGYAVYKLIGNGLIESKKNGFSKCHVVNYDYLISEDVFKQNYSYLNKKDAVFYKYKNKSYSEDSFSTGFFSGKIDKLFGIFTYYKNKKDYYSHDRSFKILEIITYDITKKMNLECQEFFYEDLKESCRLDLIVDNHTFQEKNQDNEFKRICDHYECDKTSRHTYHNVYTKIFEGVRGDQFSLLEIGIDEGKSLNVWGDYLSHAKIFGLDIGKEFSHNRGYVFKADQNNLSDLKKITSEIKSCRFIIDDGSHNPQHQIKSFNYLFENLLEDGGYYIIEDVETSYWDPLSVLYGYEIGYLNVVDYFGKLTHNVNHKYNGFDNTLKIESIMFTSNCIVIKKLK
jgi:hypothetical protein